MATLTGKTIAGSYKDLLKINANAYQSGVDSTLRAIEDGDATASALWLATDSALMSGADTKLYFYDADGGEYISADASGVLSIAAGAEIDLTATAIDLNGTLDVSGTLTVGADGSGTDVIFYSGTAGDNFTWDASEELLTITGTNGQTALNIADGNLVVADSVDIEGDIDVNGTANLDIVDIDGAFTQDAGNVVFNEDSGDYDFRVESNGDANMLFVDGGNNRVGIGTASPDTNLHIHKATAGSIVGDANVQLLVENSTHVGMQFLSPNDAQAQILFGDVDDGDVGFINYNHSTNALTFATNTAVGMTINSSGNVGIGTTTVGVVNGNDHTGGGAGILHIKGSVPAVIFEDTGDTDAQWKIEAQDIFTIKDVEQGSTTETTRLSISAAGKVGIGVTAPVENLHLSQADSDKNYIHFTNSATGHTATDGISIGMGDDESLVIYQREANSIILGTSATTRMTITSAGNVGIGTASPSNLLDCSATAATLAVTSTSSGQHTNIRLRNSADSKDWYLQQKATTNSFAIRYEQGSIDAMVIDTSGNVGIGETAPDVLLEIAGAHVSSFGMLHLDSTDHAYLSLDASASGNDSGIYFSEAGTPQMLIGFDGSENHLRIMDSIAGVDRMVITQAGNVAISANAASEYGLFVHNDGDNTNRYGIKIQCGHQSTGTNTFINFFESDGGNHGSITQSGSTTAYNTSSDYRLKENEEKITDGLERLEKLKPYKFNFKKHPDIKKDGFFAHEVSDIIPEAITGEKDAMMDEEVSPAIKAVEAVEAQDAVYETVTKQRQKVVVSEVEEEVSSTEIVLEDGKYVQKTTTETVTKEVSESQWEDVPLYGEDGEQLMRLVSEAIEAVDAVEGVDAVEAVEEELWAEGDDLPEDVEIGDVKVEAVETVEGVEAVEAIEAQDAVYEGITHRIPEMEDYEEEQLVSEAVKAVEGVDGHDAVINSVPDYQGIDQAKLVPLLVAAVQELSAKVAELESA
jgi:hypothetical protein